MLTTYGMKKHESKCLYNPNRVCTAPYCAASTGIDQEVVDWVKENAKLNYDGPESSSYEVSDEKIQELREKLDGCPICTIAVLVNTKKQLKIEGDDIYWQYSDFRKDTDEMYKLYLSELPSLY